MPCEKVREGQSHRRLRANVAPWCFVLQPWALGLKVAPPLPGRQCVKLLTEESQYKCVKNSEVRTKEDS